MLYGEIIAFLLWDSYVIHKYISGENWASLILNLMVYGMTAAF
jgi:hypothetical protein